MGQSVDDSILSIKEATSKLIELESRLPVNEFLYREHRVWPIIRGMLWSRWIQGHNRPHFSNFERFKGPVASLMSSFSRKCLKADWESRCLHELSKHKAEAVFFSHGSMNYHENIRGYGRVHKFFDPVIEELSAMGVLSCKIEVKRLSEPPPLERKNNPVRIELPKFYYRETFKEAFVQSLGGEPLSYWKALQSDIEEIGLFLPLHERELKIIINQLILKKTFFKRLLKTLKAKLCFVCCYYDQVSCAMTSAARELGIRVVDIQHGKQGAFHGYYTHWTKLPAGGYELLPTHFWSWGEESAHNIESTQSPSMEHPCVIGGNPWLAKFRSGVNFIESPRKQLAPEAEKFILVSLQPERDVITQNILDSIRATPKNWHWHFRLHPALSERKKKIESDLSEFSSSQVSVGEASDFPLYALLSETDHHITKWSTVCYEALAFGVATSLVHQNGIDLFQKEIKKGQFFDGREPSQLVSNIEKLSEKLPQDESPYILGEPELIRKVLSSLLPS